MNRCRWRYRAGVTAALALVVPVHGAEEGAELVDQARCYACHHETDASLGPPYRAIALRHAERRELMLDVLARKIVHGGGGNWGLVPMVPNEHVTLEEARTMAAWILALADD